MTVDTTIRCHDCGCFGNVKFHQCGDDRFRHPSDTSSVCSNILCDECKKENGECRSCRSAKYAARMEKEKIESRNKKISLSRGKDFPLFGDGVLLEQSPFSATGHFGWVSALDTWRMCYA
jgi:hypothetical protein